MGRRITSLTQYTPSDSSVSTPAAGWRSAVVYTVVANCKLVGVNPENYIAWVLPKLAAATNKTATGLLPHDYALLTGREDDTDDVVQSADITDLEP